MKEFRKSKLGILVIKETKKKRNGVGKESREKSRVRKLVKKKLKIQIII